MTNGEFALAVIAGCFAAYGLLMSFGNYFDRRKFSRAVEDADEQAAVARENSAYFSRKCHELDQGVGRAVCRIISAHSEEHCLRRGTDPDSYFPGQGKEHAFIAQGMLRALNILEEETGRYKEEKEDPRLGYARTLRRKMAEERVGAPGHGPVTAPCVMCGGHSCTYRWGQWVSKWSSETNDSVTHATSRWQDFDQDFSVGWLSLCLRHATALDEHGNVTHVSKGYHRG